MKKYILTLALASVLPFSMAAQSPQGRLPKTVVADVLAKMPSQNKQIYNNMMGDIVKTGPEAMAALAAQMGSPTLESSKAVEYAIGGLSFFVTQPGFEKARKELTQAYINAIEATSDRDIKSFFLHQLNITGADDAIVIAKKYAQQADLSSDGVALLVNIGSPEAKKAIEEIAEKIPSKQAAAKAIGDLKVTSKEPLLVSWIATDDAMLKQTVLYALSQMGSADAIAILSNEAKSVEYAYEPTYATEAYLVALKNSDPKTAIKNASKLLKNKNFNVRSSALEVVTTADPSNAVTLVKKALSDPSREYRNTALRLLNGPQSREASVVIVDKMDKYNDDTKEDILNWLKRNSRYEHLDKALPYINNTNKTLAKSAIEIITRSDEMKYISKLIDMVIAGEPNTPIAMEAFQWGTLNICEELLSQYGSANDQSKTHIINLLRDKRYTKGTDLIISQLQSTNAEVQKAAYNALANVVSDAKYFNSLCDILEKSTKENTAAVQAALSSQVVAMKGEGAKVITTRYLKAPLEQQAKYFAVFPATKEKALLTVLENAAASSNQNTKAEAIGAITSWSGTDVLQTLYNIVKDNSLSSFHQRSVRKYTDIIAQSRQNGQPAERRLLDLRKMLDVTTNAELQNILLTEIANCNTFNSIVVAGEYLDNPATCPAAGNIILKVAVANKQFNGPMIVEILNKFIKTRKGNDAPYEIEAIKKHINDINTDNGYVSLFNGKDLTGWKGLVANPIARSKMNEKELAEKQMKADDIMRTGWKADNGILVFTGKGDNLCTEKKYGDFEMFVDWMITPEGDAGIYLRGTPQVQIWDTSLVKVGAQVGSGGLYNNSKNPSKPTKLADNKIGDWNTFYIKMVGDRVTVLLNGVKVVDNVIMENYWNRNLPIFPLEQLELQAHGTYVAYRNIYVKELEAVKPFELSDAEKKEGFKVLFDGTSMHQWTGNTKDYTTLDGTISLDPKNGGGGNLYTKDQFKDFVFRFEFQLTPGANNGLGIRTPMKGDAAYEGMELQILDSEHPIYKDLQHYQYHGSVYGVIPAKRGFLKPTGQWNTQEVVAKGNKITITLNGEVILDGDIAEASKNGTLDKKEHPGLQNPIGHIGFLGHGSPVKFRNIRIKEL